MKRDALLPFQTSLSAPKTKKYREILEGCELFAPFDKKKPSRRVSPRRHMKAPQPPPRPSTHRKAPESPEEEKKYVNSIE